MLYKEYMLRIIVFLIIFAISPFSSYAATINKSLYTGSNVQLNKRYQNLLNKESGKTDSSLIRRSLLKRLINTLSLENSIYPLKYAAKYKGKIDVKKLKSYIDEIISAENQLSTNKSKLDSISLKSKQIASLILAGNDNDKDLLTKQLEYALLKRDKLNLEQINSRINKFINLLNSQKSSILKNCSITQKQIESYRAKWKNYKPKDYSKQITKLELLRLKDENNLSYISHKKPIQFGASDIAEKFPLQVDIKIIQIAMLKWKLLSLKQELNHIDDGANLLLAQICSKKTNFRKVDSLNTFLVDDIGKISKGYKEIIDNLLLLKKSMTDISNKLTGNNQEALGLLKDFGQAEAALSTSLISTESRMIRYKTYFSSISDFITLKRGVVGTAFISVRNGIKNLFTSIINFLTKPLFVYKDISFSLWNLLKILLIALSGWIVTILAGVFVRRLSKAFALKETHSVLIKRILSYVIWLITILIAFNAIGLNTSSFTLIAGALSVGIGFGLQSIASNIAGGVVLLFDRSIKLGDYVEVEGITGRVAQINLRKTIVKTNDNIDYIIPNSSFVNGKVINWTYNTEIRRFRIPISVNYGVDLDELAAAVVPEIKKLDNVKSPPEPEIWLAGFGESSLDFEVVFWAYGKATRRPLLTESDARKVIYVALKNAGITIPFPQRVIHLQKD